MNAIAQKLILMPICIAFLWATVIKPAGAQSLRYHHFPESPHVSKQTWFWEGIFYRYGDDQMVIHDANHPEILIDVIDYKVLSQRHNQGRAYTAEQRRAITRQYLERYREGIQKFTSEKRRATRHGAIEQRLYSVYSRNAQALQDLYRGDITIRSQSGLADEFARAAERSHMYLPYMERIFARAQLPIDLTRIAFVESMFNRRALSKVGASGMWQFMPATARDYMTLNHFIDERNSPLKATEAAAALLTDNYRALQSWPLAITAYNHGRGGMARAARQLNTNDMDTIIKNYRSRTFGFASKNFYAEFLAARNIYNKHYRNKRPANDDPMQVARISLDRRVSVSQLLRFTSLDRQTLEEYNPCLLQAAYTTHQYRPLPDNFEIIVPRRLERQVRAGISNIAAPRVARRS